ncbi:40S ribosomal protein S3a [Scheffersomyces amazonensis]|uniref:40S ribosomal protein S3a n=1 Tax=Scheffersomyces amazonensis TaxID=1078765 RepID=UPI00315C8B53
MTVGKNKTRKWKTKKGGSRNRPFDKKDWFGIKAPEVLGGAIFGSTPANRGHETVKQLKGRVIEVNLNDLMSQYQSYKKFKLIINGINGKTCLTSFYGMELTRDKLNSLTVRGQSFIEANLSVKTIDDISIRIFVCTSPRNVVVGRKGKHAQTSQIKLMRNKILEIIKDHVTSSTLDELVRDLMLDTIIKQIEKSSERILPLYHTHIRKVKLIKGLTVTANFQRQINHFSNIEDIGEPIQFNEGLN